MPLLHEVYYLVERVGFENPTATQSPDPLVTLQPSGGGPVAMKSVLDLAPHQQCACEWWWFWAQA